MEKKYKIYIYIRYLTNINNKIIINPNNCKIFLILINKISNLKSRLKNKKLSLEHKELIKNGVNPLKNKKETVYKKYNLQKILLIFTNFSNIKTFLILIKIRFSTYY